MTTIYKKDTKGKIRVLEVTTMGDVLAQTSGLLEGKQVTTSRHCKPKNKGRANSTTAEEQAKREAEAIIVKKLKEGYFSTIKEAEETKVVMPMLAKKADLSTIEYPIYQQRKFDGIRCMATNTTKLTRKNREITTMSHIDLTSLPDGCILDGELFAPSLSFQEGISVIKKYQQGETEKVLYFVYDYPSYEGTFTERITALDALLTELKLSNVYIVETLEIRNQEEVLTLHTAFIEEGMEGSMLRTDDTLYEFNKRSSSLLKLKDFIDKEYLIVDIVPSDKRPQQGLVVCKMDDGQQFTATPALSHEEREQLLKEKDKHIGKVATVEFFEYTDSGKPRFPIYKATRDYE